MAIVKTDIPMTSDLNWQTIRQLREAYPFLGTETLGWSAFGRPIQAVSAGGGQRRVFFSAAHHANEWITAPVLLKFLENLARARETGGEIGGVSGEALLREATIYAVPLVNPDGVDLVTGAIPEGTPQYARGKSLSEAYPRIPFPSGWRANLNGVDLNLQYPAGWRQAREIKFSQGYSKPGPRDYVGQAPLTQREAFLLARYTERISPDAVVALHAQGQVIYWQFENYQIPGARALGERMAQVSGYTLADTPYASGFAGYKDWFLSAFRRPGYTVEVGKGENPLPLDQFDDIYRAVEAILVTAALGK